MVTTTTKPIPLVVIAPNIPRELTARSQWVNWLYEPKKDKSAEWTKPPYISTATPPTKASSTDLHTWSSFDQALAALPRFDGVGFVLSETDDYVALDLDHCRDADLGSLEEWAQAIVQAFPSYWEVSPSGTGLRCLFRGRLPDTGKHKGAIEVYDRGRYVTMTGHHLPGTPSSIESQQAALDALLARVFPPAVPPSPHDDNGHTARGAGLDDEGLVQRARGAANGAKFSALWAGNPNGYPSPSEADFALCMMLAFWTNRDAARMDRLFRQSGLVRGKWDEHHGSQTYGALTIAKANAECREVYQPRSSRPNPDGTPRSAPAPDLAVPLTVPDAGVIGLGREFADLYSHYLESPRAFFYFTFLTYFGALIARKVTLDSELRPQPRLYTVLIGESADARKSFALTKTDEFFRSLGPDWAPSVLLGVGSAEGIAAELKDHPDLLLHFDELKAFVDKARNEHSVALPMVSTLFERSDYDNRVKTEKISVRNAALSLVAGCTAETYATIFDHAFLAIGFPNRLFLVADRSTTRIALPTMIPEAALEPLRARVRTLLEKIETAYEAHGRRPVPYRVTSGALERFRAWYVGREGSIFERRLDTYGHRLLVLLAASSGREIIDEDLTERVMALLRYQLDVRRECDPVDADNAIAAMEERVRRTLARGALKSRDLKRKVHYNRVGIWVFNTAIENLKGARELAHDPKLDLFWLREPVTTSVTTSDTEGFG